MNRIMRLRFKPVLIPLLGASVGLAAGALIFLAFGFDPLTAYQKLFQGAFGSWSGFSFTLLRFIPLSFTGLAVTVAYRAGVFNIGAEGQLNVGALAATAVGVNLAGMPGPLHLTLAVLAGMAAGAVFAWIPGYLKARFQYNEILITILLNYIGLNLVGLAVNSFLKEPGQTAPQSARILDSAKLPMLGSSKFLHVGLVVVLIAAVLLYLLLWRTTLGYEIRCTGVNPRAAMYGGINVGRVQVGAMVLSGVLASMAGVCEILGVQYRLFENFMVGYGYNAIPVALLGGLHPIGTLISALFFGALTSGANAMQIATGAPVAVIDVILGVIILGTVGVTALWEIAAWQMGRRRAKA